METSIFLNVKNNFTEVLSPSSNLFHMNFCSCKERKIRNNRLLLFVNIFHSRLQPATFNILKLGCRMFLVSFFNTFIELKTTMLHPSLYLVKRLLINLSGYSIPNILPDSQLYIVLFLNKGLFACKVSELMKYSE